MATLIPNLENILSLAVKPTAGELHLLETLNTMLPNDYEIYFNPYLNGDRPDIVVFHQKYGVLIIEVKDWNLGLYKLDARKNWKLKNPKDNAEERAVIKSPLSQVLKYKDNLYELHIEKLLELKIKDIKNFNFVSCAVYFHNGTSKQINDLLVTPYKEDKKYMQFLKWNIRFLSNSTLDSDIRIALHDYWMDRPSKFSLFTEEISDSIKRFLQPTVHMMEEGKPFKYIEEQKNIIFSTATPRRIKGVFGSGKTTVMARRAVETALRGYKNILILTYNITLKNFIHDKINQIPESFNWSVFTINNYHEFINSQLNNMGISIEAPTEDTIGTIIETKKLHQKFSSDADMRQEAISIYFEENYYGNLQLFEDNKEKIRPYNAIFIDEIQDYHRPWMVILKNYFVTEGGQYVLFGDVKQNIYNNQIAYKDVITNVLGRPTELKSCHRSMFKVRKLALDFQEYLFRDKYEIDMSLESKQSQDKDLFSSSKSLGGYVNYMYLQNVSRIKTLYNIIKGNIDNEAKHINPNDITILGYKLSTLQRFEAYYRYKSHEKTTTMFETYEIMYLIHLNYFNDSNMPNWYSRLLNKIGKTPKEKTANNRIALLLTIYHLMSSYPDDFENDFVEKCNNINCTTQELLEILQEDKDNFNEFENSVFSDNYEKIRKNKKIHFWMNTGTIKVSTIHSFKGWESQLVFLLLEQGNDQTTSFDELIYTAITRTRSDLIIINIGNNYYNEAMRPLIEKLK